MTITHYNASNEKKISTAIFISLFLFLVLQNRIISHDFELKKKFILQILSQKREISYNSKTMIFEETNIYYKKGQNSQRPSVKFY